MKKTIKTLFSSFLLFFVLSIIFGIFYPSFVFLIGQTFFSEKANGSLLYQDKIPIGSELIGQNFYTDGYFHPRPSYASYDGSNSQASNLAPTSLELEKKTKEFAENYRKSNQLSETTPLPIDAITASASGLDPHISPENARLQIPRIAKARLCEEKEIQELVEKQTEKPFLGICGQKRVNVLLLNIALDHLCGGKK